MKKSIIALAVVASMAAQADNTTLYGRLNMAYSYNDNGDAHSSSEFGDNGSRFGIKGATDLGNGLSSFFKYENRIASTTEVDGKEIGPYAGTKLAYVGLKGGFGAVSFGSQYLPTDDIEGYDDPFNALTPKAGAGFKGKTHSSQSMKYMTPEMNGFQAGIGIEADGKKGDDEHVDYINAAVTYKANGILAGLGYETTNGLKDETDIITAAIGYGNDVFEIGTEAEFREEGDDNVINARIAGLYKVTPMDSVYLGFANEFKDIDNVDDGWAASVGYQHKFSKRTRVWAEYSFQDDGNDSDNNTLNIGLRTDF